MNNANNEVEGDGKISGKQEAFNRRFIKKLENQDSLSLTFQ